VSILGANVFALPGQRHCTANRKLQRAASFAGSGIPGTSIANRRSQVLAGLQRLMQQLLLDIGQRIGADTSHEGNLQDIVRANRGALEHHI
jgi:hypothetical protein